MTRKRLIWLIIKIAVSLSLLVYILTAKVSFPEIGRSPAGIKLAWVALAFSLHSESRRRETLSMSEDMSPETGQDQG